MGARDSVLTGSAGEHYVLYRLHRQGILAAQSPSGARDADILVFSSNADVRRIQVKTRTQGADGGWAMRQKHESLVDPGLAYALVDLEPAAPNVYIVPSAVIAAVIKASHSTWLAAPGKGGRVRRDSDVRRLRPAYGWLVDGFPAGWLETYRERWDLLR